MFRLGKTFFLFLLFSTFACLGASLFIALTVLFSWWKLILPAYAAVLIFLFVFFRRNLSVFVALNLRKEEVLEAFNVAEEETLRLQELKKSLEKKIRSYQRLEIFTERLNNEVSLEEVCGIVVGELFELFEARGNVLLYLVNPSTHRLELKALKKEDPAVRIPEKTGDMFDHWALRHNQPLLVESASNDFRFDPERIKSDLRRAVESLICVPLETETRTVGILRIESRGSGEYSSDDLRLLSVIADIAKLAIENAFYFSRMRELSITDGLTGIFLRRHALERLKEECARSERDKTPLSFLMVDIDHFKAVNDTYGHIAGDAVLKKLAHWLKLDFSIPGHLVFRYGGEEFGVVLPGVQKKEAVVLAESFRKSLHEREVNLRREKITVRVSVGVSAYSEKAAGSHEILQAADDALLRAKRSGRDRVCF
ncbi:MAG: sensor domain-containing diguanylate cyclase [Candidatus Omnitrophota bacterium]